MLDLAAIVAGTKYRGQFEERMKSIMKELEGADDIILFIDEIHTMVGAGGQQVHWMHQICSSLRWQEETCNASELQL